MSKEQCEAMLELQQLGLTLDDLREYLDTHDQDDFAIQRFNMTAQAYQERMEAYVEAFGPLTQRCADTNATNWLWAQQDFPWTY